MTSRQIGGVSWRSWVFDRWVKLRRTASELASPRRTALRVRPDRRTPRRTAFARHGDNTWLVPPIRIVGPEGIELGRDVVILEDSSIVVDAPAGARLRIGDNVHLAMGAEIICGTSITIGNNVSSSDFIAIVDTWSIPPRDVTVPPPASGPVVIEDGAYLACGSIIGPGVRVGRGAFIGEGAVVLEDVAPHTVVYGNPARPVRRLDAASGQWEGARHP